MRANAAVSTEEFLYEDHPWVSPWGDLLLVEHYVQKRREKVAL